MDDDEQHLGMRMELALDKAKRRLEPEKLFDCEIIAVVSRFRRSAKRTFHDGSVGKGVNADKRDSRYEMQDARCEIGGVAVNSHDEHVPEKPEGNDQGNDVFPPDAGQDSAPCARRLSEEYHANLGRPKTADGACTNFLRVNYGVL